MTQTSGRLPLVTAYSYPYNLYHDQYQEFYRESLRAYTESVDGTFVLQSSHYLSGFVAQLNRLRYSYRLASLFAKAPFLIGLLDGTARCFAKSGAPPLGKHHTIGRYLIDTGSSRPCRICVDATDNGEVANDELAWCDLYFKTNYWPEKSYPGKVLPFVNGNPVILPHLAHLKQLRSASRPYDVFAFFRFWGGPDERTRTTHTLRLLEALHQLPGNNYVQAYLLPEVIEQCAPRLDKAGIKWRTTPLPTLELWSLAAQSKINIVRLGYDSCIPWRAVDLLAMGACTVFDCSPNTSWPEPLCEGKHYLDLGLAAEGLASAAAYEAMAGKLLAWLADDPLLARIRCDASAYFDRFLTPEAVGRFLVETVQGSYGSHVLQQPNTR